MHICYLQVLTPRQNIRHAKSIKRAPIVTVYWGFETPGDNESLHINYIPTGHKKNVQIPNSGHIVRGKHFL